MPAILEKMSLPEDEHRRQYRSASGGAHIDFIARTMYSCLLDDSSCHWTVQPLEPSIHRVCPPTHLPHLGLDQGTSLVLTFVSTPMVVFLGAPSPLYTSSTVRSDLTTVQTIILHMGGSLECNVMDNQLNQPCQARPSS